MALRARLPRLLSRRPLLWSVSFLPFLSCTPVASAQTPTPPPATLSVDARLVNIPVVVYDKKGALVTNLTKADFALQVDGHPQVIRYFDLDRNLPLILGLLVDTSQSQRDVLDEERTASSTFLDTILASSASDAAARTRDQAFIIQFAHTSELLQDLTDSRPRLQAALRDLDTDSSGPRRDSSDPDAGSRHGGTVLYDALFLSADELMAKQHGRKALILLTDGVDSGSKENLTSAIEAAQRADTIVYAIYFKGQEHSGGWNNGAQRGGGFPGGRGGGYPGGGGGYPGGGGGYPGGRGGNRQPSRSSETSVDGRKILERICGETGGRLFEVSKKQTVANIYTQIAEELRSQYRLGYTPDQATAADGYHQIDLSLAHAKNLTVQTRDGYYTGK